MARYRAALTSAVQKAEGIARYAKEISRFILFLEFFLLCFHRRK